MIKTIQRLKPSTFFVAAAFCFELLLNAVTPPLQAPDEFSHFYRAFQVSEGNFFSVKTDHRLGGEMPQGLIDFSAQHKNSAYSLDYTVNHEEILTSCLIGLQPEIRQFQDFANTSYYSPVSYLPQALGIVLLKTITSKVGVLYYGGRIFTFLIWLLCMVQVIKLLPIFKWLFTFLMLLPMNPYLVNSFSADTVTNILSFLFIALVLKHVFITATLSRKDVTILTLLVGLLVMAKLVYTGIIFLLLIIPASKFKTQRLKFLKVGGIFLFALAIILYWSGSIMQYYIPYKDYNPLYSNIASLSACGDYYAQKSYILTHGFYFLKVIFNSLFKHPFSYLTGYIGVFGNGDINLPFWLYPSVYLFIFIVALGEKNKFSLSLLQKSIIFFAALLSYSLLLLSQHLIWDCVGEGIVDLVQGRYLIPLFPLLFMLLDNRLGFFKFNPSLLIIPAVLFLNLFACKIIYDRFFVGKPHQLVEYYCDVEKTDSLGLFLTSNKKIFLMNSGGQSTDYHRSGAHAVLLSLESPYCFEHNFKDILPGDIIEVEAWEKGSGALIVISGNEKNCGSFYFGGTYNSQRDKNGWLRIKNTCQVMLACKNMNVAIYLWNPGKEKVYIDDIKTTIKKFGHP